MMTPHSAELTAVKGMNLKPKELKQFVQNQGTDTGPAQAQGLLLPLHMLPPAHHATPNPALQEGRASRMTTGTGGPGERAEALPSGDMSIQVEACDQLGQGPPKNSQGHTEGQLTIRSESHRAVSPQPEGRSCSEHQAKALCLLPSSEALNSHSGQRAAPWAWGWGPQH